MGFASEFKKRVFNTTSKNFDERALLLFKHQAKNNPVYREYIENLGIDPSKIQHKKEIPFLPIQFFKTRDVLSNQDEMQYVFESSGTTGSTPSKHWVTDYRFYLDNCKAIFEHFLNPLSSYSFLALLPSYLERQNSSLIAMTDFFINQSYSLDSGYYLYNHQDLYEKLLQLKKKQTPTVLIGVTFGLLDFCEKHSIDFPDLILIETGGMKGRKKEMLRAEVHNILNKHFGNPSICSEYGMTELFSQAYAINTETFTPPPWLQISLREVTDPLSSASGKSYGAINVIDLANVDSCAFIATDDLGKLYKDGSFEVIGRLDNSDVRGCNLMVTNQ